MLRKTLFTISRYKYTRSISTPRTLEVKSKTKGLLKLHVDWLRDHCECSKCIHPTSRQKLHSSGDVANSIIQNVNQDGEVINVIWNDGHKSIYNLIDLFPAKKVIPRPFLWEKEDVLNIHVDHDEYMKTEQGISKVLKNINKFGLCILENVPTDDRYLKSIIERIGPIRNSFYGDLWDVKNVKDAKNIAYTSLYLGLHMDLMYFETPPGVQFLHCLSNSVEGGESIFLDSFKAVSILRKKFPEHFNTLQSIPINFEYKNQGKHYQYLRCMIETNLFNEKLDVFYAPPFQGKLQLDPDSAEKFYLAMHEFEKILKSDSLIFQKRLEKGQCVLFHNIRVLHGRLSFNTITGERHFKGGYLDWDDFQSAYRASFFK
ncbi:Clavaminate synthase-like protein [Rozella allomycis CSF55]|uniref:Clavaminate synthase-like protein n=1 Tax=Rozella allomycis (strain CSF55) TaxID=988480 RepID=A0A075ANK5_ROZAC|nr:Taurine catabolism dioxygenase TauD/TfdA domain-containing protein [Rozella allomycis CSF55]RKP17907.1 Clavaminate synthase-like protein [Rozella allomycis CSF55]|eukprot:EPZ31452.1 Taurine catabolism dioxygenase TauD/TfdA domain-containing protein [Rozella allomycis CSF55]